MHGNLQCKLLETKLALLTNINKCLAGSEGSNPDVLLTLSQALAIIEGDVIESGHCGCE